MERCARVGRLVGSWCVCIGLCVVAAACDGGDGTPVNGAGLWAEGSDAGEAGGAGAYDRMADNCDSDAECGAGFCLGGEGGVCAWRAAQDCASAGTTEGCPEGSRCWGETCYPDCDHFGCGSNGHCDGDGSCVPAWSGGSSGGGGGGGTRSCSCHCSCAGCSATVERTCYSGVGCSSCASVCGEVCAEDPRCGYALGASGSCN